MHGTGTTRRIYLASRGPRFSTILRSMVARNFNFLDLIAKLTNYLWIASFHLLRRLQVWMLRCSSQDGIAVPDCGSTVSGTNFRQKIRIVRFLQDAFHRLRLSTYWQKHRSLRTYWRYYFKKSCESSDRLRPSL